MNLLESYWETPYSSALEGAELYPLGDDRSIPVSGLMAGEDLGLISLTATLKWPS